jgi:hypothetical protein
MGRRQQVSAAWVLWQGAWQEQAAAEHEPACGRGWCGRGRGARACERAQRVGACVMAGLARSPAEQREEDRWCWVEAGVV